MQYGERQRTRRIAIRCISFARHVLLQYRIAAQTTTDLDGQIAFFFIAPPPLAGCQPHLIALHSIDRISRNRPWRGEHHFQHLFQTFMQRRMRLADHPQPQQRFLHPLALLECCQIAQHHRKLTHSAGLKSMDGNFTRKQIAVALPPLQLPDPTDHTLRHAAHLCIKPLLMLLSQIRRNQIVNAQIAACQLIIPKHRIGSRVATQNTALFIYHQNSVMGVINDRCQPGPFIRQLSGALRHLAV